MDSLFAAVIAGVVGFALGVIFNKFVISEAASIKAHITAEIAKLRGDLKADATKVVEKV